MPSASRRRAAAAAAVLALLAARPAKADYIYKYVASSVTGTVVTVNGIVNDGSAFTGLPLLLDFTNAGEQSGEVSGFEEAGYASVQTSGLAGFVGLATYGDSAAPGALAGSLAIDVTFGAQGQITGDSIQFQGADLSFDIENGAAAVGSDGVLGCTANIDSGACAVDGAFALVPEPAPAALAAPLLALPALLRRRARAA